MLYRLCPRRHGGSLKRTDHNSSVASLYSPALYPDPSDNYLVRYRTFEEDLITMEAKNTLTMTLF